MKDPTAIEAHLLSLKSSAKQLEMRLRDAERVGDADHAATYGLELARYLGAIQALEWALNN